MTALQQRQLRRALDLAIGRALVDRPYQLALLEDPSAVGFDLEPAADLRQFARAALGRYWFYPVDPLR